MSDPRQCQPARSAVAAGVGEQAFAAFLAKAIVEVVAFRTTWRRAQHIAVVAADGAVEKFLPFHVGAIALRQRLEMTQHQPTQFAAIAQAEILPEMIGPHATTREHVGKQTLEWRADRVYAV